MNAISHRVSSSLFAFFTYDALSDRSEQNERRACDIMKFYELQTNRDPLGADTVPYAANAFPSAPWECFWRYVSVLTPAVGLLRPPSSAHI